jgi:inner membrane protein
LEQPITREDFMDGTKKTFVKKITEGYTFKVLILVVLILLLLIPLTMIRILVNERGMTAGSAEEEVMEAWGKQFVEAGPFIIIPGVRTAEILTKTEKDGEKIEYLKTPFTLIVSPENLGIEGVFKTEVRKRGIFSVPLYASELNIKGSFNPDTALAGLKPNESLFLDQAELLIMLSNSKGIRKINKAVWNDEELLFQPGNRGHNLFFYHSKDVYHMRELESGIFASLHDLGGLREGRSDYNIEISIQGGQSVRILPAGRNTHVSISADWVSPSFQGAFLPNSSNVTDSGFNAVWDISYLSRDIPLFWQKEDGKEKYSDSFFGVDFFRAIDTYALNTRAVKYAVLFLMVPFLTLFLLEIFTKRRIHPVPYLLSGLGNVIFYLLLLSLSEQLPFFTSYLIAALAVTIMMTLYARTLVNAWNKSWYMGLVVTISYILLYAVLNAESYALLIGSIGAFVVVALVMFLTRKLDWHGERAL